MNDKVKNVIILTHGVNTHKNKNWLLKFKSYFDDDSIFDDTWYATHINYGYLFFAFSPLPFVKRTKIKEVQNKYTEIQERYPNAKIHIIAHSYGTMLTHEAIKRSNKVGTPLKIGKIINIGGIVSEFEVFKDTLQKGQIESIHNFCSYKDWVVHYQPVFGKCGYFGFLKNKKDKSHYFIPHKDLQIKNYRFDLKHSQYFDDSPPDFYLLWAQILRKNIK